MLKFIHILFLFWGYILCIAQQHPVRITPVMTPPYSLLLPEIAQSSQDKIQLHILMTDLNEPSHQVSLRFKLLSGTSSSIIAQSTPFVNGLPTQNLLPGQPIILSNLDVRPLFKLQNLAGINPQQYAKPLPQGLYQFCFQVIDQHTRRELSNLSCVPVYLQQYEPPFLVLPKNAEIIQKQNEFQNILFQWMPRQIAPNTQYTFTLKEINDNIRDPHSAFLTARTLWQENTLAPNLFYGIDKTPLITGKRYAWQVKATSANPALPNFSINPNDDTGIYQNNGLSEIFFFDYTEHCELPKFLMAKNQGRGKTQILWSFNQYQPNKQYLVQYRKKDSHKDWAEIKTYAENAFITNLEDLTTYEYRVGASCNQTTDGRVQFAFSDIQTFTTDSKQTQNQNYQCGVMPNIDLANQQLFQGSLGANDTFTAGDFPVTIISAEGNNGIFSGKGYIQVPYLADTKILVAFDNISINTDRRLINGVLETEYDPNEKNVMGVTTAIGELFGDAGAKNMTLNYTIKDIKVVDGKIIIYGNAGEGNTDDNGTDELSQQELELGRDYAITDASGKIFNIDENGNITDAGTLAKGGGSNPQNTDGVDKNGKVTQYTAEGVSIEWKEKTDSSIERNTQYAFDTEQTSKLGNKGKYPKIKTQKGKLIYAPFKAVVNGKTDRLEAIVHISDDKKLENSEIVFKTTKGKNIKADLEHQSNHQRKYTLTLQGTFNYAEEEVIATIVPKDSLQKQQVISSFTLVHLEPKKIKLSLVPLDEKAKGRLDDIKKNIIDTYKTVGVEFDIQEKEVLDISSIVSGNTIDTQEKSVTSTYSKQQNAINALYPDKEERYVLFVTSKNSSKNLKGYFRLNGQFGYIFGNADEKTPAHEVGHGVFKLEHPWTAYKTPEGKTNLLMDYSKGQMLSHLDWEQINDPKLKIYAFQKQQEGEINLNNDEYLGFSPNGKVIKKQRPQNYSGVFLNDIPYFITGFKSNDGTIYKWNGSSYHNGSTEFELDDTPVTGNVAVWVNSKHPSCYTWYKFIKVTNYTAKDFNTIESLIKNDDGKGWITDLVAGASAECIKQAQDDKKNGITLPKFEEYVIDTSKIKQSLETAKSSFGNNVEFSKNGKVYRQDTNGNVEEVKNALSIQQINNGEWADNDTQKIRFTTNENNVLKVEAFGIHKNTPIVKGKTADIKEISENIRNKTNTLLTQNKVTNLSALYTSSTETFADGGKLEINGSYGKIISEGISITTTLLKTGEVESRVYLEKGEESTIKAPGLVTGSTEVLAQKVTDLTSLGVLVYDIAVDEQTRQNLKTQFSDIKTQIGEDPKQFFPILGEVILTTATGNTPEDWEKSVNSKDNGEKSHLATRGVGNTVITAVTIFSSAKDLPKITKELGEKIKEVKVKKLIPNLKHFDVAGEFAKGKNIVEQTIKWGEEQITLKWKRAGNKIDFGNRNNLAKILGTADNIEAHHIIPWKICEDNNIIRLAALDGFHPNMIENGLGLEKYTKLIGEGLHGNHPAYDNYVREQLNKFSITNPTPEQANKFLQEKLIPDLKTKIIEAQNSEFNLNEYFKTL